MIVKELTTDSFKEFTKNDYVVVDCYGENCAACVMLEPVFDEVATMLNGIDFGRINLSFHMEIAQEYGIEAMPTLLFFRKGVLINQLAGCMETNDLLSLISELLYK